ncbi:MAG: hypothetical protein REI96_20700 [Flavobacterium nitrogenifigens]|uniref:hypothetical protein n=1 Tax=Flavobacterium nitrogenifigens TaxID=1617283 RepID=UPI002809B780|nr:hypothetical protein [Flavobacterium nitrogenifigens]MDQ8014878.1 hypothetical protein [Flavobacterium nitrogenifigens]
MRNFTLLFMLLVGLTMNAQDAKSQPSTKMDVFISKTGVIRKFIDYNFEPLKSSYDTHEARVRKIIVGAESKFFFQLVNKSKYGDKVASIEYNDLLEVIKALGNLKSSVESDIALKPDYLENKFVTADGFELGYYVSEGKVRWVIHLEKYGSDNTIILNDIESVEKILMMSKSKIEELKK